MAGIASTRESGRSPGGKARAAAPALWLGIAAAFAAPAQAQTDTRPPGLLNDGSATHSWVGVHDEKPAIFLVFDEALDTDPGNLPTVRAFFIRTDPTDSSFIRPSAVAAHNATTLRLESPYPFFAGQTVQIAYVDATSGDDAATIQDAAGNDHADFLYVTVQRQVGLAEPRPHVVGLGVSGSGREMTRLALRWRLSPTSPQADSFDLQYAASVDEPAAADWRDGPQAIADFGRPCQRCRSYTLGELTPGTPYWIRVRGTNSSGDGAWSPARKIRTVQGDRPRGQVHRSMPLNPVAGGDIGSPLQWRDGLTFSIVNYRDGSMFEIAPATGQLRTKIGVDYRYTRYWLRARAADGLETDITFNVFVHRGFSGGEPAPPAPEVAAAEDVAGGVAVTWRPTSGGDRDDAIVGYQLGYAHFSDGEWSGVYTNDTLRRSVSQTDTGIMFLEPETEYRVSVLARYSDGSSGPWSAPSASVRTGAAQPLAPLPAMSLALPENGVNAPANRDTNVYFVVSDVVNSHEWGGGGAWTGSPSTTRRAGGRAAATWRRGS